MIQVQRISKPSILRRNEVKWTNAITNAQTKQERDKAISKYKHSEIKESLSSMFHGKCAFCESYIENVDYGDIEHFRPKSRFPELSVEWENLLLSCKKCNGIDQKGDRWPSDSDGGPLINPCSDDPDLFFEFIFDETTQIALVIPKNKRGDTSEKIYGLNKHELLKDRNKRVRELVFIAKHYQSNPDAREIIEDAILDSGEFAAFARMVAGKYC